MSTKIEVFELTDGELESLKASLDLSPSKFGGLRQRVVRELEHRDKQKNLWKGEFDGYIHPVDAGDSVGIVRCVHEGVCPVCGRRVDFDEIESYPADWVSEDYGWQGNQLTCPVGHKATAEPTELGSDWTGWIDSAKGDSWMYAPGVVENA